MQLSVDNVSSSLEGEIEASLAKDARLLERERAARRIKLTMEGIGKRIGLPGAVNMFGSFSNGFKTGSSDLDIVFTGEVSADREVSLLGLFADVLPDCGFDNVTRIFQASTKLVKCTDMRTQMEVDFCISNELGVRNSLLLGCYCECDARVPKLGRLIKEWAKSHELVGSADGYVNSYAYMLLVIFYLQQTVPPVLPNLQMLATEAESVPVISSKWGHSDVWETKFCNDVAGLEKSSNESSLSQLLVGFFRYYAAVFDWKRHAVCMRQSKPGQPVNKFTLHTHVTDEQWYIEDPFDLKHNLAGRCSRAGCERILATMASACQRLATGGSWQLACPLREPGRHLLKCRVGPGLTPQAFLEHFEEFGLVRLHFPKAAEPGGRGLQAFLEFGSASARRRAHTRNESYLQWHPHQLHLHVTTELALHDAVEALQASGGSYSAFEMRAYLLEREARLQRLGEADAWQKGGPSPAPLAPPAAAAFPFGPAPPPGSLAWPAAPPGAVPPAREAPGDPAAPAPAARPPPAPEAARAGARGAAAAAGRPGRPGAAAASGRERACRVTLQLDIGAAGRRAPPGGPLRGRGALDGLGAFYGKFARPFSGGGAAGGELWIEVALPGAAPARPRPPLGHARARALQEFHKWAVGAAGRAG